MRYLIPFLVVLASCATTRGQPRPPADAYEAAGYERPGAGWQSPAAGASALVSIWVDDIGTGIGKITGNPARGCLVGASLAPVFTGAAQVLRSDPARSDVFGIGSAKPPTITVDVCACKAMHDDWKVFDVEEDLTDDIRDTLIGAADLIAPSVKTCRDDVWAREIGRVASGMPSVVGALLRGDSCRAELSGFDPNFDRCSPASKPEPEPAPTPVITFRPMPARDGVEIAP